MTIPFVLLDDARPEGARDARLYRNPAAIVAAYRPHEVAPALERLKRLADEGFHLAGHLAYEAGLALEPRLAPLAPARSGAAGPLLWFGAFASYETIPAVQVPAWLAEQGTGADEMGATLGPLEPALSPGAYARAFAALGHAITAGDIYQANLTFPLAGPWHGDPLALYAALRPHAAAGYGGVVHDGSHWLLSFSPELFFALDADEVTTQPMKGTRPRAADPAEDAALAAELAASPKERAENLMILDLMRNDLSRVAQPGSVRVEQPFAIESYPSVHQMVSTVKARLRPGADVFTLIRALFPCGSITGAPKIRAMELIDAVEPEARGAYCGAIGRIDPRNPTNGAGGALFNVAIRTLSLTPDRAVLGVGSAVTADSTALAEWRECLVKGGFVSIAAGGFDLIETMAFTPEQGIALLERHLERAQASARELGFAFDRHAIRNAIQALCFEIEVPAQLRLLYARSGAHALEVAPLPAPLPAPVPCAVLPLPLDAGDWRLRHKTTDRALHSAARRAARAAGAEEALFLRDDGLLTEGSFTNIFVERDGLLLTPPARLGLLPGVFRGQLLEEGRAREAELRLSDIEPGFLIGNALRGLIPAKLFR